MDWNLRLSVKGAAVAALMAATVVGCAGTTPTDDNRVSVRWELRPESDSCGKLAGSLALVGLFDMDMPPAFIDQVTDELERRCPDVEPEAFHFDVFIGLGACGELREMLGLAQTFDVTALLDPSSQRMADELMANLEDEIARRCPSQPG